MKKVVQALSDDLVAQLGTSSNIEENESKVVINKVEDDDNMRESITTQDEKMRETTTSLLRVQTSGGIKSSRSRSRSKIKIQAPPSKSRPVSSSQQFGSNSQQLSLFKTDYHVTGKIYFLFKIDALLDICVVKNGLVYGCGEFGLKEYELTPTGQIKTEVSLIGKSIQ